MKLLSMDRHAGEEAGEPTNRVPARGRLFRKYCRAVRRCCDGCIAGQRTYRKGLARRLAGVVPVPRAPYPEEQRSDAKGAPHPAYGSEVIE